jgi:integrase
MPKRRTRGDGGLTQRHDHPTCPPAVNGERPEHRCQGRWQGTLRVIEAGNTKTKYVYGRTQKETKRKLDEARAQKAAGTLVVTTLTVDKWLDKWLERQERRLKPSSMTSYGRKCRLYVRPYLGRHRLTALHPDHIDAMYDAMRAKGLAEGTIRTTHIILKKALSDAVKRGILGSNPVDRLDAPGTTTARRERLAVVEVRRVLDYTDHARWWLALFYGMRQGECLGLRWCDVDWANKTLRVQQTLQNDGSTFGKPKSEASDRIVPMVPVIEARMRLHWIESGSPTVARPCDGITGRCEHGPVFAPIHPRTDNRHWHQLLVDAARPPHAPIPDVSLHAARNSASDVMEAAGIPDRLVAQILGHAQVQTTHGYQHAEVERMRDALSGMGRILELD